MQKARDAAGLRLPAAFDGIFAGRTVKDQIEDQISVSEEILSVSPSLQDILEV